MPQPFSSIPGFPSWGDLTGLLQAQNRLLEQLPTTLRTMTEVLEKIAPAANDAVETVHTSRRVTSRVEALVEELEQPIRDLIPAVEQIASAATDAVETVNTSRRVTSRVEALVEELEQPIRDLIPAIEKLTTVLNDPAIAAIPATVQRLQDEVHPILDRFSSLRGSAASTGRRARQVVDTVADRARRGQPVQDRSRD